MILTAAYDDPASKAHAMAAGATGYFIKPFSGQKLLDCIAESIRYGALDKGYGP